MLDKRIIPKLPQTLERFTTEEITAILLQRTTGLDTTTEHGAETPARFVRALREMTTREPFKFTTFENKSDVNEMVVVDNIDYVALCNHHILPFFGKAHVAYIPQDRIAGLSKFPRAVKNLAKGLHVQEELTNMIADYLEGHLQPLGLAVVMKGRHMCMELRGVESMGSMTTTSAMRGVFLDPNRGARTEFLSLIKD